MCTPSMFWRLRGYALRASGSVDLAVAFDFAERHFLLPRIDTMQIAILVGEKDGGSDFGDRLLGLDLGDQRFLRTAMLCRFDLECDGDRAFLAGLVDGPHYIGERHGGFLDGTPFADVAKNVGYQPHDSCSLVCCAAVFCAA